MAKHKKKQNKILGVFGIVALNLIILAILELGFQIFGAGVDPSLTYKIKAGEENYIYFNVLYAYKFCTAVVPNIPAPPSELFKEKKDPDTYRIFVIGESTSKGFPYSKLEAFPGQLQQVLTHASTEKKFEVINISMAATNSQIGVDVINQIVGYKPDLVILYYGHNEFIGFGGSGKNLDLLYKLNLFLYNSHIYQTIKLLILNASKTDTMTLLEQQMSGKHRVRYNSPVYNTTINNFSDYYERMILKLKKNNIDVIACGVAKNLKDFQPLNSVKPARTEIDRVNTIVDTKSMDEFSETIDALTGDNRNIAFELGRMLLSKQKKDHALVCFNKSCDLDEARLRAPAGINTIIRNLSQKYNCTYIDFQSYLNQHDSEGIAGNELFLEHVHTTLPGHSLISLKLGEVILKDILKMNNINEIKNMPIQSSIVDKIAVCKTLYNLYTQYPLREYNYFNGTGFKDIYNVHADSLEGLSFINDETAKIYAELDHYYTQYKNIDKIHFAVGVDYLSQDNYEMAYGEFYLTYALNPMYLPALNNLAVMRYFLGDTEMSYTMMKHAYQLNPAYKIGLLNFWLYNTVNKNNQEEKKLEKKLDSLNVEYQTIQDFTYDLNK
ncbi:MAG: SGNH/GDSL hydrolase family protein [Spirochaetales bacterium]|nr:SGNH/GDSL hydrolase family protein [Spirochaetales bacterium]